MKYRKEIDGLRAVAVLPVILFHAGFKAFEGGFVGVDIFFVISGYLITTIILSDMNNQKFSIVTFYERRARRILPALFLVMLCCLPFAWMWLTPNHLKDFSKSLAAVSLFSSNFLFWQESGYFATDAELKPLLHTWSLAVEEQYYIFFPLFLMVLWKLRKRWIFGSLIVVGTISLAIAQWGAYHLPSATFFLLPTRGWELAIGALIAFFFLYKREHEELVRSHKKTSEVFGFIGLLLICYSIFAFDKNTPFPSLYALVPTVGTGLIIIFSTSETAVGRFLGIKPMVGVGLISYSTYLWHQPLFVFARHRSLTEPGTTLLLALSAASILLAYISWRFVEKPFRSNKTVSRKAIISFAIAGSVVFASVGMACIVGNGIPERFPNYLIEFSEDNFPEIIRKSCNEFAVGNYDACSLGKDKIGIDAMLIGDSHSNHYTGFVDQLAKDANLRVHDSSMDFLPPIPSVSFGRKPDEKKALYARDRLIEAEKFDIVILAAVWDIYGRRSLDNKYRLFDIDGNDIVNEYRSLVRSTIKSLIEKGKKVVIIKKINRVEIQDLEKAKKMKLYGADINNYFVVRRPDKYMGFLDISKNLTVIDPNNVICEGDECSLSIDGTILYRDGSHLNYSGSSLLGREYINNIGNPLKNLN